MFVSFKEKIKNSKYPGVFDIHPTDVKNHASKLELIDVRQPDEFTGELGHIKNAKLIVLNDLRPKLETLPKNKTIVFICRSGARSGLATQYALEAGFTEVYNMLGGMLLWNELKFEKSNS